MQELIDEIKEAVPYFKMDIYQPNFNKALEKEKEQIMRDYRNGKVEAKMPNEVNTTGTEYYNQTYNQNK